MSDQQADDTAAEQSMAVDNDFYGVRVRRLEEAADSAARHLLELVAKGELSGDLAVMLYRQKLPYYDPDVPEDYIDAYFNRLVQFMGPTPMACRAPDSIPYHMAMKRHHRRDDEIFEINPAWMTPYARASLLFHLEYTQRLEQALRDYPNLASLVPPAE